MKLKTKMITSVVMAILVMSMLVVGVFAVKTANFQVGGNITFSAKGIYATISQGKLANCSFTDGSVAGTDKLKAITINTDKTETQINSEFLSWQGLNLKFDDDMSAEKTTATLTFTITNTAATGSNEYIDISVSTSATEMKNARVSVANSKNAGAYVLQPQEALTYTITFKIIDTTANASLSRFAIDFNMQRLTALPTISYTNAQAKGLDFTFDEENKTASAKKASTAPTGALTIPRMVTYNNEYYTVTSIGERAFYNCTSLTSITIPDNVTSIGERAFYKCSTLTSITIPDSVTSIGESAFDGCSNLKYNADDNGLYLGNSENPYVVLVKAKNTSITSCEINSNTKVIYSSAFYNCSGLTSITMPDSVTSIGERAFYNCTSLTSITIPDSVTSIGEAAFYNCSGLTSITIPDSVTSIGERAFEGCSGLGSIEVSEGNTIYDSRNNCNAIIETSSNKLIAGCKNTVIPDDVTSIGGYAFYGCSSLTSITIPNSVTSIGDFAFQSCKGLTSITIPDSVTSIGDHAFYNCSGLTSITIPDSVTSIGYGAFGGCSNLIYNPYDNGQYLGNDENPYIILVKVTGKSITSCEINSNTKFIHSFAFHGCSGLTSITIPDSVTSIGDHAFNGCSGLTSITIPASVTSIGDYAFYNCSGLTTITINATTPPTLGSSPIPSNDSLVIKVPSASVDSYKSASGWSDFADKIQAIA